ncbi:lysophospholipase L1-like esterase [Microvirga flocculans]|uniref:Lysophospholipase L1-like esterase n=1 Tax=Microvirga flocculans TaxID=217168 RepID=A0A7W6IH86_9HYPH|nr:SGNH/GDSL hydrolase family protein [Microvirga flocculans]MBB4041452.1 lysophospholipase L1-like esterase [Microvirga flocculans]
MSIGFTIPALSAGWAGRHPRWVAASLSIIALCCGLALWAGGREGEGDRAEIYAERRLQTINTQLDEARKGFIFMAGDSHAELMNAAYRLCGREVVNGGVSGARAELYEDVARRLEFAAHPEIVVLTIGTGDVSHSKDPLSPRTMSAFERSVARTVALFGKVAKRVVVTALPPIGPSLGESFEIPAVAAYSERLRALCAKEGCEFVDPFMTFREEDGATAQPGATRDGLHMSSYRVVQTRLAALICPNGSL